MANYSSIGKRPPRIDALEKVTGRALFSADVILPGMLCGKVLRSPLAHARITRLDTAEHGPWKGSWQSSPRTTSRGSQTRESCCSPCSRPWRRKRSYSPASLYAAVAAIDRFVAEEALSLIDIEYEPLPSVTDVLEAMKPDAPSSSQPLHGESPGEEDMPSNVFWYMENLRGDIEEGFREADIVLENTFRTADGASGSYLEPRASVAVDVGPDGRSPSGRTIRVSSR